MPVERDIRNLRRRSGRMDRGGMQGTTERRHVRPEITEAAGHLVHLGFLLVSPFPPEADPSRLSLSLRPNPTQQHFDIEQVRYWRTGADHRGHAEVLTFEDEMPLEQTFAWGKIELVDRFGAENDFVTMGGTLLADRVEALETVAVFSSPAPILRMGGHSQADDLVALEMGAFFARIMVPIDFNPAAEPALSAADPLTRYAAFIAFQRERYLGHLLLRREHPRESAILWEEAERLRAAHPEAWRQGRALLETLGLRG
jgi:hypothetical protein